MNLDYKRLIPAALLAVFVIAFVLRMVPSFGTTIEFIYDSAFNYRMTKAIVDTGSLPKIDPLSTYPEGKEIRKFYPVGLFQSAALFHKAVNLVRQVPLERSILLFCALCGALIVFPVYCICAELFGRRDVAVLCAALGGIIPGFLGRSLCYYFRFEVLAVPLLFTSLFFLIKACSSAEIRKTVVSLALSCLFMLAALYVWRLSVLFLLVYAVACAYLALKNRLSRQLIATFVIAFVIPLVFTRFVPGFGTKFTGGFGAAWIELLSLRMKYLGVLPGTGIELIAARTGDITRLSDFTRLYLNNIELEGVTPLGLFGPFVLSFSAAFLLVYLFGYLVDRKKPAGKDILFVFILFFTAVTISFSRNKMVLAPLAAIAMGEGILLALREKVGLRRTVMLCVIAVIALKTGFDAYAVASHKASTKQPAPLTAALQYIDGNTPRDAVILSYWGDGWPIQTYTHRATNTDGLFESPDIVARIIEMAKVLYGSDEEALRAFCAKYGITHILFPTGRKFDFSTYAGVPYYDYFERGEPTALGRATVLYRMLRAPQDLTSVSPVYHNDAYVIYAVARPAAR